METWSAAPRWKHSECGHMDTPSVAIWTQDVATWRRRGFGFLDTVHKTRTRTRAPRVSIWPHSVCPCGAGRSCSRGAARAALLGPLPAVPSGAVLRVGGDAVVEEGPGGEAPQYGNVRGVLFFPNRSVPLVGPPGALA